MTKLKELKSKLERLSPGEINDLDLFVEALLKKYKSGQFKQNWAGGLKAFKKQFSSIELQKKALEWRRE